MGTAQKASPKPKPKVEVNLGTIQRKARKLKKTGGLVAGDADFGYSKIEDVLEALKDISYSCSLIGVAGDTVTFEIEITEPGFKYKREIS